MRQSAAKNPKKIELNGKIFVGANLKNVFDEIWNCIIFVAIAKDPLRRKCLIAPGANANVIALRT